MKPTLIYAYDPLCGWCYGFHPVLEKIIGRFPGKFATVVKTGGLVTGDRVKSISEGHSYIKDGMSRVEQVTGVEFGRNFKLLVEEGSYLYNSLPSCRAQVTVNEIASNKAVAFAGAIQRALFVNGKSLNETDTFLEIAELLGIDTEQFLEKFESEWSEKAAKKEFEWCQKAGATGFPTLMLKMGNEFGVMARGYRPYDTVESHLHHLLNNLEKLGN